MKKYNVGDKVCAIVCDEYLHEGVIDEVIVSTSTVFFNDKTCRAEYYGKDENDKMIEKPETYYHIQGDVESFTAVSYNTFNTKEKASAALKRRNKVIKNGYRNDIKDANDLVNFALKHILVGMDENYEAKRAYIERAKELGFTINE